MRYMGNLEFEPTFFKPGSSGLDPRVKAELMPYMQTMPDEKARDLLDLVDASPYGKRTKMLRIGIGAAAGFVVGLLLGSVTKKR